MPPRNGRASGPLTERPQIATGKGDPAVSVADGRACCDVPADWAALAGCAVTGNGVAEGTIDGERILAVTDTVLALARALGMSRLPAAPVREGYCAVAFFRIGGGR